ncbi:olfactory receptor 14J1-like, partial [Dryobates pubescens]|uniref:olfactory receptor 14J1-like n=1 Tax=Dryobates pubescens TaxID=118200 RepID=UPI0023B8BCDE
HYETLLGSRVCLHLAAAAWGSGALTALLHTANTFSLPLCQGIAVDQFFCEVSQILKLSCSTSYLRELWLIVASVCLYCVCFVFLVVSYVQIFRAVLRIPSQQGRHKAFATCLPHLAVVSLFLTTGFFSYLKPSSISSPSLDLVVSVLYSVVPPYRVGLVQVPTVVFMPSQYCPSYVPETGSKGITHELNGRSEQTTRPSPTLQVSGSEERYSNRSDRWAIHKAIRGDFELLARAQGEG